MIVLTELLVYSSTLPTWQTRIAFESFSNLNLVLDTL
jgi:hypothetical protein